MCSEANSQPKGIKKWRDCSQEMKKKKRVTTKQTQKCP